MGCVLAGAQAVGGASARSILGRAARPQPQGHALGSSAVGAGGLPLDRTGSGVASASRVVRAQRLGGLAGSGCGACGQSQALPLPRPAAGAQAGGIRSSGGALAGSVQRLLRRAAVRPDQHLLRGQSAVSRGRQAPPRLLARSSVGLRAGGHRVGGDARGSAVGLRGHGRQYGGQHHAARLSRAYRAAVRQSPPRLGDGPRGSHPSRA